MVMARTTRDDLNGRVKLQVGEQICAFAIEAPCGPGDGTISEESAAAPTPLAVQVFRHEGATKGHTSYDHQTAYSSDIAQTVTLYSISRMLACSD